MKINLITTCFFLVTFNLSANQADFTQPVKVNADHNDTSFKDNVSIYLGNVEITQGRLKINADNLEANASAGEGNEVFIATGKPARFTQILEDGKVVSASADEIRYELANRQLTLSGNAELTQSGSLVRGAVIRYNIEFQQLSAERGEGNSRVTTIFTPEGKKQQ